MLDAFCDALWLEDGLSKNTIASYRADLSSSAFLKKDLLKATKPICSPFSAREGRASSAARRVSTPASFYQYCLRERRIKVDPTLKLDPPKRAPRFPKSLSEADVEALLAAPNTTTAIGLRDRAMLELLYATGLRVSELVALKTFEVNLDAAWCARWARAQGAPGAARRGGGGLDSRYVKSRSGRAIRCFSPTAAPA